MQDSNVTPTLVEIERDIREIVGGNFAPDHLGPDTYAQIVARVQRFPLDYLTVFQTLFLGTAYDPIAQSQLYLPTFLKLVATVRENEARAIGRQLLELYNSALVAYNRADEEEQKFLATGNETIDILKRLNIRRAELQNELLT